MSATPQAAAGARGGMAALFAVHFGSAAMMRVCDPMLPTLAHEFGVRTGEAAATVSGYAIAYGVLQFFYGPAGDRYGKRRVIAWAALATLIGNVMALLAPTLPVLVLARVLGGAAAAGIIALVLASVGDTVAYAERQTVLAKFMTASLTGMMAGQWLSGVVTEQLGWRVVFALLILLFGVAGTTLLRHPATRAEPRAAGGAGHLHAIAQVLRLPWARAVLLFVTLEGAFAFSTITFLPAHLVAHAGLGLSGAAAIVALYGVGGLGYAMGARWLVPRLGEAGVALLGGGALALGWLALAADPGWWVAPPAAVLTGLGFYALHGVLQTHATQMAPQWRGTAVCLFASALFVGISAGVALAAPVVDQRGALPVFAGCGMALGLLGVAVAASVRRRTAR